MRAGEIGRGIRQLFAGAQSIDPTNHSFSSMFCSRQIKAGVSYRSNCLPLGRVTVMALGSIFGWGFLRLGDF